MDVTPVSPGCLAGIFSNGATVLLPCFCSALTGPICMTVVAVSRWKGDFQNIGIAHGFELLVLPRRNSPPVY